MSAESRGTFESRSFKQGIGELAGMFSADAVGGKNASLVAASRVGWVETVFSELSAIDNRLVPERQAHPHTDQRPI